MQQELKLVEKFDQDGDGALDAGERKAAREFLAKEKAEGRLRRGPGGRPFGGPNDRQGPREAVPIPNPLDGSTPPPPAGLAPEFPPGPAGDRLIPLRPFGRRENLPPPEPGRKLTPADVKSYPAMPLYDPQTLRTFFLEFENADWEKELSDFHNTDVEVPATLIVDGKTYRDVGIHFRGMSSFMMVGEGRKHSLALALDFKHKKQGLKGYNTLTLLNSHEDPSFLRAVLYFQIAREYLPAPKANFTRVVINGESWGIYVNKQQFNKDFVDEWFDTQKGARWKAPGSPGAAAGLEYLGEDVELYKRRFELKSKDDPKAWKALIHLSRVLNETPADQLEEKLQPILNIDGVLHFLALENVLINNDGYWIRASDYCLYQDEDDRFHIIPHDANETFSRPGGPGFPGGRGGPGGGRFGGPPGGGQFRDRGDSSRPPLEAEPKASTPSPAQRGFADGAAMKGVELDPLVSATDARKPLLSKLLAVPALRERYLTCIKEIAETWLDWNKLRPLVVQYEALIAEEVRLDTRKLEKSIEGESEADGAPRGSRRAMSLQNFAEQRRAYLLNYPAIKSLKKTSAGQQSKNSADVHIDQGAK